MADSQATNADGFYPHSINVVRIQTIELEVAQIEIARTEL
jgi:hypothetical protein